MRSIVTAYRVQTPIGPEVTTDRVAKAASALASAAAAMKNWDRRERRAFDDEERSELFTQYASDLADVQEAFAALMVEVSEDIAGHGIGRFGNDKADTLPIEALIADAIDELYLPSIEQTGEHDFSEGDE